MPQPIRSRHRPGHFKHLPLIASRGVGVLICLLPLIMTGIVLIQVGGGQSHLFSLAHILRGCLFVGLAWWFMRDPIPVIILFLVALWYMKLGWWFMEWLTPEAW